MKGFKRTDRVGSLMRDILSETLLTSVGDPRVRDVTITRVTVTADFSLARVYVRALGADQGGREEALKGLASARGFLRAEVGQRIRLLRVPQLEFHYDDLPEEIERVERILDSLKQ
jgi:ribosome-binding factor A